MLLSELCRRRSRRMNSILFVSMHDGSRGPLAASIFNKMANPALASARSAGVYPAAAMDELVVEVMDGAQLPLVARRPQRLTPELLRTSTLVIHISAGRARPPIVTGELRWDVPLIRAATVEAVAAVASDLEGRIGRLIAERGWRQSLPCVARA